MMWKEEWSEVQYWHTDPESGRATNEAFFDWWTYEDTNDIETGCYEPCCGYLRCFFKTPAGANVGYMGPEGGSGKQRKVNYWLI